VRESEISLGQTPDAPIGIAVVAQHADQATVQRIEHARLDVQHHVVQVLEHVVDGAGRIADTPRDLAGRQSGEPLRLNNVLRSIENQLTQLLRRMR